MASAALKKWQDERAKSLDEIAKAHVGIGGSKRGRRFATEQINRAYTVLLSSEFQAFCRDLHTECVTYISDSAQPINLKQVLKAEFLLNRTLDRGNPNPGNIGKDFNRFGLNFWDVIKKRYAWNTTRHDSLNQLNHIRNAIAHNDFTNKELNGKTSVVLRDVQSWRNTCDQLAKEFDIVMKNHLKTLTGTAPW